MSSSPFVERLASGTPFRVLTLRMRSDLRFAYVLGRRRPTAEAEQVPDPFNPPPRFAECSVERFAGASVAVLPDAVPLPWLDQAEARPAPAVESAMLASEFLGNERRIWVSMPPGVFADERALPFVVHLDGTPDHSAPSVRDALVHAGLIRPCAVVLVDQLGVQRNRELLCNPAFSRMLVEELLPWLHHREFAGGHDYAWWRGLFADALQWCFPPADGPGPRNPDGTTLSRSRAV